MIIAPDPRYNPNPKSVITAATKLAPGIALGKFLGGYGDRVNINHIQGLDNKKQVARNLYLHAEIMRTVATNQAQFDDYRLVVAEGLYRKGPGEVITPGSVNDLATVGRAVVYELRDNTGRLAVSKTFDLAAYWKDRVNFDLMILDYDTFHPNGSLNVQIVVTVPNVPSNFEVVYKNRIETYFNGKPQAVNELVEVKLA
jgi:hypothetical protein